MNERIKYLTISDIHLGHNRNKTQSIVDNLDKFLYVNNDFKDLDIIFIAGDLFDTLLDLSNDEISMIMGCLSKLMWFCGINKIKLRILKGTPSHDWNQSKVAESVYKLSRVEIDFKYIDTLFIECIKDLQLHILYVPDEWTSSTELTFNQVQQLLKDNNIEQVDIAIMHGMFNYQLRNIPGNMQKHNEADYLNIVKHYINIGHIHTYSHYERIIAQGSFDRLSHGEEEPKGGVVCEITKDRQDMFYFIENKTAKIYKTIELKSKDLESSIKKIDKIVTKLPIDSYVRIKANKDHPLYSAFDNLKLRYPFIYFSKTSIEDDEEQYILINTSNQLNNDYIPLTITRENYKDLLLKEINSKYKLTDNQFKILNKALEIE